MTRPFTGLCLPAFALSLFSFIALDSMPASAQAPDMTPQAAGAADIADKKASKSHNDASSLALLGLVGGGAALMGGGHRSGSDSSNNSASVNSSSVTSAAVPAFTASATAPQVIYTHIAPPVSTLSAPVTVTAPVAASASTPAVLASTPAILAASVPVVTVTYPAPAAAPVIHPIVFASHPAPARSLSSNPGVPSESAVPEPGTLTALALGILLLAVMTLRSQRKVAAPENTAA